MFPQLGDFTMSFCSKNLHGSKEVNFATCEADDSPRNFLLWYSTKPERHRYKNHWPQHTVGWNKVLIQEYLHQMYVPIMDKQCVESNGLNPRIVHNLFSVWIEEMSVFLLQLSSSFFGLPGGISSYLSSCQNLSMLSWTKNPVILSKILHASRGGLPSDVMQHVLPGCDYIFGPWLCYCVSRYHNCDLPFRLEDKNPTFLNHKFPIKRRILREKTKSESKEVVRDPTRVEVQETKHHGTVVMRSKFSVMARFLFWFFRTSNVDPWTSFHLCFQTEYYLSGYFRIYSLSQLEAEMDWLIAWISLNDMSSCGLPCTVFKADVLTPMKEAIRAKTLPLEDSPFFGYKTYRLDQIIPSILAVVEKEGNLDEKFDLLLIDVDPEGKKNAKELCCFVHTQARAHFSWMSQFRLENKVDNLLFRLVFGFGVVTILEFQNVVEDLVEFSKHSSCLCCELLRLLSIVLRCQQPRCYDWKDGFWRKTDELGHPLFWPEARIVSFKCNQDSQQVKGGSLVSSWSEQSPTMFHDDCIKHGGQMPCYGFHTGTGFKQVVVANSMNIELKQSLLGRTKACNSEGNVPQALVAKTPHAHAFCPGKFSFWQTTDKHLFHFLCDEVAKKSTNKCENVCLAWSLRMTDLLNDLGITTTLELHHDLCCVPSGTLIDNLFNDADRNAALLAFWQVEELQFFNLSYFTRLEAFDWEDPFPYNPDPVDTFYDEEDERYLSTHLDYIYQPQSHTIPLCVYIHEETQKKIKDAL